MSKARFIRPTMKVVGITGSVASLYYLMARCVAFLIEVQVWEPPYRSSSDTSPAPQPPSISEVVLTNSAWVWGVPLTLAALASGLIVFGAIALCFKQSRDKVFLFLRASFQSAVEIVIKQILDARKNNDHAFLRWDVMRNVHRLDFCSEEDSSCSHLDPGVAVA